MTSRRESDSLAPGKTAGYGGKTLGNVGKTPGYVMGSLSSLLWGGLWGILGDNTPLPFLLQGDHSCKLESFNGFDDAISLLLI